MPRSSTSCSCGSERQRTWSWGVADVCVVARRRFGARGSQVSAAHFHGNSSIGGAANAASSRSTISCRNLPSTLKGTIGSPVMFAVRLRSS